LSSTSTVRLEKKISRINSNKKKKERPRKNAAEEAHREEGRIPSANDDSWRPNGSCCDDEGYWWRATSTKALKTSE
jgi:hypothetical protein